MVYHTFFCARPTNFGNIGLNSPRESNFPETVRKFGNHPAKIDISTFQKQSKLDNAESSSHPRLQIGEAINEHSPVTLETRDKESQTISSTVDNAGVDKSPKADDKLSPHIENEF